MAKERLGDTSLDWENIPDNDLIEEVYANSRIQKAVLQKSKNTQKLMAALELKLTAPKEVKGAVHFEYCVLGDEDDPMAHDPNTRSKGQRILKRFAVKSGVKIKPGMTLAALVDALDGKDCGIHVIISTDKESGEQRNRIARDGIFSIGEREPKLVKKAGAVGVKPKPKVAPVEADEDDEDEEETPAPVKAKKKPAPVVEEEDEEEEAPAPKKKKAAVVEEDDDDEEDEEEEDSPPRRARRS